MFHSIAVNIKPLKKLYRLAQREGFWWGAQWAPTTIVGDIPTAVKSLFQNLNGAWKFIVDIPLGFIGGAIDSLTRLAQPGSGGGGLGGLLGGLGK